MTSAVRAIVAIGAVSLAVPGMWAFLAPESFFEQLANWPPYNAHFIRDIGAFQVGIASVLVVALLTGDGATVALGGLSVGSAFHALSHFIDAGGGGRSSDPILFMIATGLFVAGLVLHLRSTPRGAR